MVSGCTPSQKQKGSRPRVGGIVLFRNASAGRIEHVAGPVCWFKRRDGTLQDFRWVYPDATLNALFNWSTKNRPAREETRRIFDDAVKLVVAGR